VGLHDDQWKHLEERIDRYLREQHYSDFAGYSIKLPDRRKLAVEWFAKHMRAIMQVPDPPRQGRGWAITLDEAMAMAQDPSVPLEMIQDLQRQYQFEDPLSDERLISYTGPFYEGPIGDWTGDLPMRWQVEEAREKVMLHIADSPICTCATGPSVCQVHGPPADR
jgi:hypothetical protein